MISKKRYIHSKRTGDVREKSSEKFYFELEIQEPINSFKRVTFDFYTFGRTNSDKIYRPSDD